MKRLAAGGAALALMAALGSAGPARAAGPKVYVGLFKDDAVAVVDSAQNRVVSTIAVPKGPHGLVITPDGRKVYVSSDGASTVSVIDTATDKVVASIDVGASPHGLAMSRDGRKVLVSGFGSSRAVVIDTTTDKVVGEVGVPQVHNGTISPDGTRAWVASQKQGETAIIVLDLQNMTRVGSIALDKTPRALDVSPDGRRVYFTLAGVNAIQVLDTSTNQVIAQVPVGASPHMAPPTPDGRWDVAVVQGPGELAVIDTASNTLAATVPVGKAPRKIAVQPLGAPRAAAPPGVPAAAGRAQPKTVTIGGVSFADHGTRDVTSLR